MNENSHLDNHPFVKGLDFMYATYPKSIAMKDGMDNMVEMIRHEQADSNAKAVIIMHDYNATKRPFALFLRSFETEAYHYPSPENTPEGLQKFTTAGTGDRELENKIIEAFEGKLAIVGVANPAELMSSGKIPRLILPDADWKTTVQNLVDYAHLIIIDCYELAPGVVSELDLIKNSKKQDKCIVIIPAPGAKERLLDAGVIEIFGGAVTKREKATKTHEELSSFKRIVYQNEIDFHNISNVPAFSDLLQSAAVLTSKAASFDVKQYATYLNNEGVALFNEKKYVEAYGLYQQALLIRRHLDDKAGMLSTMFNMVGVCIDGKYYEEGFTLLNECIQISKTLLHTGDEGLASAYMGFIYKQLRERKEAFKWLKYGLKLLEQYGDATDFKDTLIQLAGLYDETGDSKKATACYEYLRNFYIRKKDKAGELQALGQLASDAMKNGKSKHAIHYLEEVVTISASTGDHDKQQEALELINTIRNLKR